MNTNEKLEVFRKLYCLGLSDIEKVFEGTGLEKHLAGKYITCRDKHGFYGNFAFLFELDTDNAKLLLKRCGL